MSESGVLASMRVIKGLIFAGRSASPRGRRSWLRRWPGAEKALEEIWFGRWSCGRHRSNRALLLSALLRHFSTRVGLRFHIRFGSCGRHLHVGVVRLV
jgi:hypothetical protein